MPITERVKPETLHRARGFAHAVVAEGTRTLFVGGQIAVDLSGDVIAAGDHDRQAEEAIRNVVKAVEAAGATTADVTRLGVYVADYSPANAGAVFAGIDRACADTGLRLPTMIVVGVTALTKEGAVVEIDAQAVF
jgi:enamine deaminase RidA (YjgF/YER057c/UK114 family)